MTTNNFPRVTHRAIRTGTCPVCGKRVKRSRVFEHTVNPFNRNPDGSVKDYFLRVPPDCRTVVITFRLPPLTERFSEPVSKPETKRQPSALAAR